MEQNGKEHMESKGHPEGLEGFVCFGLAVRREGSWFPD